MLIKMSVCSAESFRYIVFSNFCLSDVSNESSAWSFVVEYITMDTLAWTINKIVEWCFILRTKITGGTIDQVIFAALSVQCTQT